MPIPAFFIFVNSMHVKTATVNIWRRFYKKGGNMKKKRQSDLVCSVSDIGNIHTLY